MKHLPNVMIALGGAVKANKRGKIYSEARYLRVLKQIVDQWLKDVEEVVADHGEGGQ